MKQAGGEEGRQETEETGDRQQLNEIVGTHTLSEQVGAGRGRLFLVLYRRVEL